MSSVVNQLKLFKDIVRLFVPDQIYGK